MKIMNHIDVKNVIKLIIILNGLIWFQYVYSINHRQFNIELQAEISDTTGAQWITIFRNEAEALLGISADEFGNHKINVNKYLLKKINHIYFVFEAK